MSIEPVQSFRTPDGKLFSSEQYAYMHMNKDSYTQRVKEFIDAKASWGRGQDTRALNTISEFLAFEASKPA